MYACLSFDVLDNRSSDRLTLGSCTAEDPRKRSVECEVVWLSGSLESCKQRHRRQSNRPVPNRHVLNRPCTSYTKLYIDNTFKGRGAGLIF